MHLNSESIGDPSRFLPFVELERRLDLISPTPTEAGHVAFVMVRGDGGRRELPSRIQLSRDGGVVGDAWSRKAQPDPQMQIAVMQARVAELIANGQPLALFGDCLHLDLDLSQSNLPPGSQVRIGGAILLVTPAPHNGCRKFQARFGPDALRLVAGKTLRHRNLRGIYMRVMEPGEVALNDPVQVLSRPET
jgi:MOSC domain-containing protein YiiM